MKILLIQVPVDLKSDKLKNLEVQGVKEIGMLGIEDKGVLLAYLLCIGSSLLCVIYGIAARNQGDEPIKPEDVKWVAEEKKAEKTM